MKRSLSLSLAAFLLLSACSSLENYAETGEVSLPKISMPEISMPFTKKAGEPIAVGAEKSSSTITILHTNDWHSQFEPLKVSGEPEQGGVARLSGLINQIRGEKGADNVLLLSGGDNFQGSFFYTAWKGSAEIMAMNHLRYDATCFGNHEFDMGPDELTRALTGGSVEIAGKTYPTDAATIPFVGTNIDASGEPELAKLFHKTLIVEKGGERYGILGATTETTAVVSSPGDGVKFLPYIEAMQSGVDALTAQGVNKIILLSHTGYEEDLRLIQNVSGVDVIVSGHDHALLGDKLSIAAMDLPKQAERVKGVYPTLIKGKDGKNVVVVSAMEKGRWLGQIDVTFDSNGEIAKGAWNANPVFVRGCDDNDGIADCFKEVASPDAALAAKVETYHKPIAILSEIVVGQASRELGGRGDSTAGSASMGDLVTDVLLAHTRTSDKTHGAIMNRGGVRASIAKGTVRFKDVNTVLPFDNTVTVIELNGAELLETLDNAVGQSGSKSYGAFPHIAGMAIGYCSKLPCANALRKAGDARITSLTIDGEPLRETSTYRIATNDYLARGGDYYEVFKRVCSRAGAYCRDTGDLLKDVVADWFRKHSPIAGTTEPRIVPSN